MSLPIGQIIGILADNLRIRKSVMPLSTGRSTKWAKDLKLPFGGETVIYTGNMYQLMPYTASMSSMVAKLDGSWITKTMGLGRIVNKFVNISWFMAFPGRKQVQENNNRLRNIARLLRSAGVDFGYLYDKELYAGALVHEHGMEEVFRDHVKTVYDRLKKYGVKRVITVDPHTTNVMRTVYPGIVENFDIEVKSYIEVLAELAPEPERMIDRQVIVHDSCVYARNEDLIDQPRTLLERAGFRIVNPENSGRLTLCCGGPVESLFPKKAGEIASTRVEQLKAGGGNDVVTMCPVCHLNMSHAAKDNGLSLSDLSDYLAEAYC